MRKCNTLRVNYCSCVQMTSNLILRLKYMKKFLNNLNVEKRITCEQTTLRVK